MSHGATVTASKSRPFAVLLRQGSQCKMPLKEKLVQIYEAFFRGENPSLDNAHFWDDLFLLKVNSTFIEAELGKLTGEQLANLKETLNQIFAHCTETLNPGHQIRATNAMQTICSLVRGVFQKSLGGDCGFDVINLLVGFDVAETQMQALVERLNIILSNDHPICLKTQALRLILVIATATDNVSQNTMLEYFMINSVFESIIQLLASPLSRQQHGHDAVLLLTVLVQYRKHELVNPYIVKLSILDDELALNGYAQIVSSALTDFNWQFQAKNAEPEGGFFTALTNMVGSMFVAEDKEVEVVRANDSVLLALYEAIHLNRNFITTLTHSHTTSTSQTPPSTPIISQSANAVEGGQPKSDIPTLPESSNQPTNLLVTFLEYCSISLQDVKEMEKFSTAKLCLIILTCIAEDQYANSLMHDVNMNFRVPLHKLPMRHRKASVDKKPLSKTLACALLDLMVEFIQSHMMKNCPVELYMCCLGIITRILCYQKKCRIRLLYNWKVLWTALINLLKFVMSHENTLVKNADIFHLASKAVNIFNLFITYGDTFLPDPTSYDDLYYEIIRMHQIFDNLCSMALRYTTTEGQWKDSAMRFTNTLVNIRAIVNHFTPKVDAWAAANHFTSLTEDQVLDVVRSNYDTLTLKLQDSLDQFERYSEKPRETAFFTQLVRQILLDVRIAISTSPPPPGSPSIVLQTPSSSSPT